MEASRRDGGSVAVECGWLILVVAVPWIFTTAIYNSFTAPKVALFRVLIEGMAAGAVMWGAPSLWARTRAAGSWRVDPLLIALALYAAVLAAATIAGRNAHVGFWGLYLRWMGALTLLHAVALAALVQRFARSEAQLLRLLGAIVLGSLPVAALAVGQRLGWDTAQWLGNDDVRVRSVSTLGNASFLGSYLVWALPFTAAWALARRGRPRRVAGIAILTLQLAALVTTNTRGAWLGTLTGGLLFAGLWLWLSGRRQWAITGAVAGAMALAAVAALNLTPSVSQRLHNPVLRRLASLRETDPASSGGIRLRYWREVLAGAGESVPVLLLGHGPQSFLAVHSRRYAPVEADLGALGQFPDSSHNLLLDMVNDSGLLGAGAWLAVLLIAAAAAVRTLRHARTQLRRATLIALLTGLAGYMVQGQFLFEHVVSLLFWAVAIGLAGCPALRDPGTEAAGRRVAGASADLRDARGGRRAANSRRRKIVTAAQRPTPAKLLASAAVVAASLAAVYLWNVRPTRAEWLKMQAMQAQAGSAGEAAQASVLLAQAARLAPWEPTYRIDLANDQAARAVALRQQSPPALAAVEAAFRQSEEQLRAAVALDPDDLRSRYPLGILYQLWAASNPAHYADAERVYTETLRMSPRRQRTYWLWGDLRLAQGHAREAEAYYQQALALDPHVAAAHGAMAMLYERLGRRAEAEQFRRSAKALRPTALVIVPHAPPGTAADSTPIP